MKLEPFKMPDDCRFDEARAQARLHADRIRRRVATFEAACRLLPWCWQTGQGLEIKVVVGCDARVVHRWTWNRMTGRAEMRFFGDAVI